jgi:thioredoxin 1
MAKQICDKVTVEERDFGYPNVVNQTRKEIISMSITTITNANFAAEVLQSDKPVLVDFWASWCGPCRMIGPVVEEISQENPNVKVGKVNVDEQPELAARFGVMSIPTLIVFKNGQKAASAVGVRPKRDILKLIG